MATIWNKMSNKGRELTGSWGRCYELHIITLLFIKPQWGTCVSHACTPSPIRAVSYPNKSFIRVLIQFPALSFLGGGCRLAPVCLSRSPFADSKRSFLQTPSRGLILINYHSLVITWCCYPTDHNLSSLWGDTEGLLNIQYPSAQVGLIEWLAEVICFRNLINPFWPSKQ